MKVARLESLVAADVAEQFAAHGRGELEGAYDGETWGEYVDGIAYWEFGGRGEMTSEYVRWTLLADIGGHGPLVRLTHSLRDVWFATARSLVTP